MEHITIYVTEKVLDLEAFLEESEESLVWRFADNEDRQSSRDALLEMMSHLAEVRSRQSGTDALFGPLKEVCFPIGIALKYNGQWCIYSNA